MIRHSQRDIDAIDSLLDLESVRELLDSLSDDDKARILCELLNERMGELFGKMVPLKAPDGTVYLYIAVSDVRTVADHGKSLSSSGFAPAIS